LKGHIWQTRSENQVYFAARTVYIFPPLQRAPMAKLNSEKLIRWLRYWRQDEELGQRAFVYGHRNGCGGHPTPHPPSLPVRTMAIFPRVKQAVGATDAHVYIATRLKMSDAMHYTCTPLYLS